MINTKDMKKKIIYLLVVVFLMVWTLYPILWIFVTSLKPKSAQFSPTWFGFSPSLDNYITFFSNKIFIQSFINSCIVTGLSVILGIIIGTPTAYALARFKLKNSPKLLLFILLARMTPPVVLVIPFFLIAIKLNIADTYIALIIMGIFLSLPFVIWMMRGFFLDIPKSLEESAMIDGCNRFYALRKIVIPLAAPGLAATAVLASLLVWNEFFFALILSGKHTQTLPVLVNSFVSEKSIDWGTMSAAGIITVLPLIIFGLLSQKHLVRGLTMGSVK